MLRDIDIGAFTVFEDARIISDAFLKQVMLDLFFHKNFVLIRIYCRFDDVFPGANPGPKGFFGPFQGPQKTPKR